ncbi:gated mechanosensitive channel [Hypomontagnella monticulosa]|nr:gated mechanosensitive channel [Hypomontagnella monticulosa]
MPPPPAHPWEFGEEVGEPEEERRTLLQEGEQKAQRIFSGFVDFAFSGNILEIAFGLILATAFTAVTTSLVSDILLPPLSVILPLRRNMNEKFAVLRPGPNYDREGGYNTLEQAQNDGAIVLAYGVFLSRIINFLGIGLALYGLASLYQYLSHDPIIKHTVKCRYCKKRISSKAIRCVNCTSWLDGREERMR